MRLPQEVPVMTLPNAILFPQAMLPLYIFEPRYRKMLADALDTHRMISVALQRNDCVREAPFPIAGLGLIRASVLNKDGTSHLIVQGLTRVELADTVQRKPYRISRIRPLEPLVHDSVELDALLAKVRELVNERIEQGFDLSMPMLKYIESKKKNSAGDSLSLFSLRHFVKYLDKLTDPDQVSDLVACTLLPGLAERQVILQTVEVEARLKHLIHFLMAEVDRNRKTGSA